MIPEVSGEAWHRASYWRVGEIETGDIENPSNQENVTQGIIALHSSKHQTID